MDRRKESQIRRKRLCCNNKSYLKAGKLSQKTWQMSDISGKNTHFLCIFSGRNMFIHFQMRHKIGRSFKSNAMRARHTVLLHILLDADRSNPAKYTSSTQNAKRYA
mmetsp:Transcript_53625/g.85700  ORF Transcript_53625/g.85700 Transcript_53625/m.85700 type:complete len:106 (-) Transcript_53625:317-634(-)